MKQLQLLLTLAVCFALTSCFKDEPLNAEADIEQAYLTLDNTGDVFFNNSDATIDVPSTSTDIVFRPKDSNVDLTAMAPQFKITAGATISPESGSVHDFSNGKVVQYTVTSQDRQWKRVYTVRFSPYNVINKNDSVQYEITFGFENYKLITISNGKKQYYEWTETGTDGTQVPFWDSGNYGYSIVSSAGPDGYPTAMSDGGVSGKCVKLTTCSTGSMGSFMKMPIAAGNIFSGEFKIVALKDAVKNTFFGRPFTAKPVKFSGWYKYKPGEKMTGATSEGQVDTGDIYAVLYKRHYEKDSDGKEKEVKLNGENILTDESIVAIARLDEIKVTDEWTHFDVDFKYKAELDADLLKNQGYNIAIVASSSKDGAYFIGAVGSTMYVDEFKITCEESKTNE